jgi:hypothetical protein
VHQPYIATHSATCNNSLTLTSTLVLVVTYAPRTP